MKFINRFDHLLHSTLAYENTKVFNDKALETLKEEIPKQVARFNVPDNYQNWENHMLGGIDAFLTQRPKNVFDQLCNHYLSNDYNLTIDVLYPSPAQSEIRIQTDFDKTAMTPIQIFDLNGRLCYSKNCTFGVGQSAFTMSIHLPSGIYILRIGDKTKKFVVIN